MPADPAATPPRRTVRRRARWTARFLAGRALGLSVGAVGAAGLFYALGSAISRAESPVATRATATLVPATAPVTTRVVAAGTSHTFRYVPDPAGPAPRSVHVAGEF